jgi:hypothetical protein
VLLRNNDILELDQVGNKLSAVVYREEHGRALLISDRVRPVHYIARLKNFRVHGLESATRRCRISRKSADESELHASTLLKHSLCVAPPAYLDVVCGIPGLGKQPSRVSIVNTDHFSVLCTL